MFEGLELFGKISFLKILKVSCYKYVPKFEAFVAFRSAVYLLREILNNLLPVTILKKTALLRK